MIPVTSTNEGKLPVTLAPETVGGNAAEIDGEVSFEVAEGDATVEVVDGSGGKEFFLVSGEANTVSRITATADADLGEGVRSISEEFVYTVTSAEASSLGVTVGAEVPK